MESPALKYLALGVLCVGAGYAAGRLHQKSIDGQRAVREGRGLPRSAKTARTLLEIRDAVNRAEPTLRQLEAGQAVTPARITRIARAVL